MPLPDVKLKRNRNNMTLILILLLTLTHHCDAFFRNLMIGNTAMARVDPIVAPGEPSQHVHHLNGGSGLSFQSTGETMSTSNCTKSILTVDKSGYWAPWLYFQHENGTFEDVKLALGLTAYYKYEIRGNAGPYVPYAVFPKGLRMISGNSTKRTWVGPWPVPAESFWGPEDMTQSALQEKAMGFNCMNYEPGKNEPSFAYPWLRNKTFLDTNCINGVRAEIIFPSCWDGRNLDSANHKDHMAFPTLIQDGACPPTHPIYLPILFFETIWQTNLFANESGQFVFSNGDPTGYGYHADFLAAWDDGIQEAVRDNPQCTGLTTDGVVEECPVFQGRIQTQAEANLCKLDLPEAIIHEATTGILGQLPGDVKVSGQRHDPGSPIGESEPSPSTNIPASRTQSDGLSATLDSTAYYSAPAIPTTMATSTVSSQSTSGYDVQSVTTTFTSGHYIVEMVMVEMLTTVTATTRPISTQTIVVNSTSPTRTADAGRVLKDVHQHAKKHANKAHGKLHF